MRALLVELLAGPLAHFACTRRGFIEDGPDYPLQIPFGFPEVLLADFRLVAPNVLHNIAKTVAAKARISQGRFESINALDLALGVMGWMIYWVILCHGNVQLGGLEFGKRIFAWSSGIPGGQFNLQLSWRK